MKTIGGFIGWIIGMFVGFMFVNSIPFIGFICILGGIPLGRYIGGAIEKNIENERKQREKIRLDYERKARRKEEAISFAKKYPEATKSYFKQHWGISKSYISEYDITDDKVEILLGHRYSYERDELSLNQELRARVEAERAEQRRLEEVRREALRKAEIAKREAEEREKKSLIYKVRNWHLLFNGFYYNYLLNYYPTTCTFEANEREWNDRWTIWNFKNTPGKTSSRDHNNALAIVIPKIKIKLIETFGEHSLKYLTLVCIPASSQEKTKARYEEFSRRLCNETGMINAYEHMNVIYSSSEKKFGGSGIDTNNVSFETGYFRGKYILLFDDVITKGESMLKFKIKMEELGATVVGGFSIGKTKHEHI